MEEKHTQCECSNPGYCERHKMNKSPHLHKLCKTSNKYFQLWETSSDPKQREENKIEVTLPSMRSMALSLGKEVTNHIANGMKHVDQEVLEERLAICHACEFFNKEMNRCGKCGCFLNVKAKWKSSSCPISKW